MLKKISFILILIFAIFLLFSPYLARYIEAGMNKVRQPGPYSISNKAKELHDKLLVADLHADPLLWARDLRKEWQTGQFDLPRMRQGNVALQVFGIVTKSPKNLNFQRNSGDTDNLIPLTIVQQWPYKTWNSPFQRALYQSKRLKKLAEDSSDLLVIENLSDLNDWLNVRAQNKKQRAGMLAIEGAHALEGSLENLTALKNAGVRMVGLAHFFDNKFSGSAHGVNQYGLTELGIDLVKTAQQQGIIIDLAHASKKTISDTLNITTKPLVVSHTGVQAICNSPRNLTDNQIRAIAKTGGLIAIGIFKGATCGKEIKQMVDAIDHVVKIVGIEHVGFGLDLDGAVVSPVDVSGMPLITEELIKRGYSDQDIAKISGTNFIRVLKKTLN